MNRIDGGEISFIQNIDGGEISLSESLDGELGAFFPVLPESYRGETTVTPSAEEQTLLTEGLVVPHNITIAPIPNNYGLITWNGVSLTVS